MTRARAVSSWAELGAAAGFIDAGDTDGWAHYVTQSGVSGDVEFALGETRWDAGERIGTFLAVAQLDESGQDAPIHGGPLTPLLAFPTEP